MSNLYAFILMKMTAYPKIQAETLLTELITPDREFGTTEGGTPLKDRHTVVPEKKPLITVITVVYNGVESLEETIKSVLNQTYENVEYIIIDGGSRDGTLDIIRQYEYGIDYWVSENDDGIYDAMNKGISFSKGEWINFMNCGDFFYDSNTLEKFFSSEIENIYSVVYGNMHVRNSVGESIGFVKALPINRFLLLIFGTRLVCHQSIFYRRNNIINYSVSYKFKSELDQYIQYARKKKKFKKIDIVVADYLLGGIGDLSSRLNNQERRKVMKDNFKYLWIFSEIFPFLVKLKKKIEFFYENIHNNCMP